MAIDTPARLAVLGAGPIGLEAALYARFLGYDVVVYEAGDVAASVRRWGHARMLTPFAQCRTLLGVAAIQAQDEGYRPPADVEHLTGQEWLARYLAPLSQTDLLSDHLRLRTTVLAVGKEELLRGDEPEDRGDWSFRLLSRDEHGAEQVELFDGVLDCTGVLNQPNWLGHGGIPAIGELSIFEQIERHLPDLAGDDRKPYLGKHTLVVGGGLSAATNVVALNNLAREDAATRVTWVTRREGPAGGGPITEIAHDPLPERAQLVREANRLARAGGAVNAWPATHVERIDALRDGESGRFQVELSGLHARTIEVGAVIANVGYRPDESIYRVLRVGDVSSINADSSIQGGEPNYYVLGAKAAGRRSNFFLSEGYDQIRRAFAIIGDRESLDLYASAVRLVR
jgi:thioredoxin reductase